MSCGSASDGAGLIIFDCDGVLVDSEPISLRLTVEALRREGLDTDFETVRDRFLGRSTASMVAAVEEELGRPLASHFTERLRRDIIEAFERELRPIEGVAEVVPTLARPVCVASSSAPERIRRSLEVTALHELFAPHIFSSTMVANGKPSPDLFLLAAERMGVNPLRCIVVEDSLAGIAAARAAGMPVLAFVGGSHIPGPAYGEMLLNAGADALIAHMAELPTALGALL